MTEGARPAKPRITVAMSVFNGAEYLQESIDSILAQTEPNFEFIILDDASTDDVPEVLARQSDPRIRLLKNETNQGLAAGLNRILEAASADYVAEMDGDDLASPDRLQKEADFLDRNPDVAVVGSSFTFFDNALQKDVSLKRRAERPEDLKHLFRIASQIIHSASMYRLDAAREAGLYRPRIGIAEDFDLWLRIMQRHRVANLPDVLQRVRWHDKRVSLARQAQQIGASKLVLMLNAERRMTGGHDSLNELTQAEIEGLWEGRVPEPKVADAALRDRIKQAWEKINYWHDPRFPEKGLIRRLKKWPADAEAWKVLTALARVRLRWKLSPLVYQSPSGPVLKA